MSTNIPSTKFHIPQPRPGAVLRHRLTGRLNEGLHRRLTLICAPAGYGKTTLAGEWIACSGRRAAWLSLEEGDGELARFLTCVIAALRTLEPSLGETALAMLQSPQASSAEPILAALLNEIAAIPDPFLLVLDDYHVMNAPAVDDAVAYLLDHLPPRMHLVMTVREDPRIPLARLRARDQLTELRLDDLKFTRAEAAGFLHHAMGLHLTEDETGMLESRSEGWIAGLQLAALSMQGHEDAGSFIRSFSGSHRFVLDYLAEEVLQRQSEAVQAFLLRTSILDRLCGPLCDAVIGEMSVTGQETLERLERANLFLIPLDNERRWYRYHHLFADLLRRRLEDSPVSVSELHLRASGWYGDNGFEIEAFRHAAAAQDVERAARLLEGGGMPLHLRGAAVPVLNWLESLPSAELDARPPLWVAYASALLITGKPTAVESKLLSAEAVLPVAAADEKSRNLIGMIAATRAALASLALAGGESAAARRKLQAAEAALQGTETEDKSEDLVGLIVSAQDARLAGRDQLDAVIAQSRRALEYLSPDNVPARTAAVWMLGVAAQRRGDYATARQAYAEALSYSREIGNHPMAEQAAIGLSQVRADAPFESLSTREIEVLELIAEGLSNREIGDRLFLALDSVKGHNRRIFEKLQVQRRTEAIARARELGLLRGHSE